MSIVVSVGGCGTASVSDLLGCAIRVVVPDSVCASTLLGHVPGFQTTIAVISHSRILITAAALCACVLPDLCDLITHVVSIDGSRIDSAILPVEDLRLHCAAQHVGVDLLLATFDHAAIDRAFIGERHYFATGTAAAGVGGCSGGHVGIGSDQWPTLPVVGLLRVVEAGSVVATGYAGAVYFR